MKKPDCTSYFLPCEFKPGTPLWSVIEPFAYDISPAYVNGSLGVTAYEPESYSIVDLQNTGDADPLIGYVFTCTHPDTRTLIDKVKGYYGKGSFNLCDRVLATVYTSPKTSQEAWCYVLSEHAVDSYQQIEQVQFGIWDLKDEAQIRLLEELGESLGDEDDDDDSNIS